MGWGGEMTMKRVETIAEQPTLPPLDIASLPADLPGALKSALWGTELQPVAALRSTRPWAKRGNSRGVAQALTQLRPFVHVARLRVRSSAT